MSRTSPRFVAQSREDIGRIGRDVEVIFTDLDGTLLGSDGNLLTDGDGRPSEDAAAGIVEVRGRGVDLVLISGRRAEHVAPLATVLGARGYVAEMGTIVVVEARSGEHSHNEVLRPVGDYPFADEAPYEAMLRTGVIDLILSRNDRVELHSPWHDERETSHLLRGELDVGAENRALEAAGHGWCEIIDNGVIPHAYPGLDVDVVRAYHVVPRGTGKADGVRAWLTAAGVGRSAAAGMGDGRADLEMAAEVAIFFLMRNGLDADPTLEPTAAATENVFVTDEGFGAGWRGAVEALVEGRHGSG